MLTTSIRTGLLAATTATNYFRRGIEPDSGIRGKRMSEVTALIAEIKSKGLLRAGDKLEELYAVAIRIEDEYAELKAQRDALAENEGYKQAFYEMAEILGIGARPDSPKTVFETVMKPTLINLKKKEMPEGYVLVPQQMHLSAEAMESLCFHCGDGGFAFGDFTEGLLWVGDIENDDVTRTYGLNIATAEYPEEGSANISEFAAKLRAGEPS